MTTPLFALQLKHILPYIEPTTKVQLIQMDAYTEEHLKEHPYDKMEEVFCGSAMDIPWYFLDYYLTNEDGEAIDLVYHPNNTNICPHLLISIVQDKNRMILSEY